MKYSTVLVAAFQAMAVLAKPVPVASTEARGVDDSTDLLALSVIKNIRVGSSEAKGGDASTDLLALSLINSPRDVKAITSTEAFRKRAEILKRDETTAGDAEDIPPIFLLVIIADEAVDESGKTLDEKRTIISPYTREVEAADRKAVLGEE